MRFSYLLPTVLVIYVATASSARLGNTKNSLDSIPVISSHGSRVEQAQVLKKRQFAGPAPPPGYAQAAPGQFPGQGPTQSYSVVSSPQGGMGNIPAAVAGSAMQIPGQAVASAGQVPAQVQATVNQIMGSVKLGG